MANQSRVAEIHSILMPYERGRSCRRIGRELGVQLPQRAATCAAAGGLLPSAVPTDGMCVCHWIGTDAQKTGHAVAYEFIPQGSDHATDCAIEVKPGQWDVFEVSVTATENVVSHLEKLKRAPSVCSVTIVCLHKKQMRELQQQLASEPSITAWGDALHWTLAETIMRRVYP